MIDLDPSYLRTVKQILATHAKDKTVWAYGSRVTGTAHEGSDLDLVIIDTEEDLTSAALRAAFSESNLPILVDIVDWSTIPEQFQEEIKKAYEVIQ